MKQWKCTETQTISECVFSIPSFFFSVDFVFALVCVVVSSYTYTWLCLRLLADGFTGSCASMEQRMDAVQVSRMYMYCFFMDLIIFFFNPIILDLLEISMKNLTKISIPMMLCDEKVLFDQFFRKIMCPSANN